MKLSIWMKSNGLTHEEFKKAVNKQGLDISVYAVDKWTTGARIPRHKEMACIYALTKGQVRPNDFYNLPDTELQSSAN